MLLLLEERAEFNTKFVLNFARHILFSVVIVAIIIVSIVVVVHWGRSIDLSILNPKTLVVIEMKWNRLVFLFFYYLKARNTIQFLNHFNIEFLYKMLLYLFVFSG